MSQFLLYVPLEPFVKQWLVTAFGDPVEFPSQSSLNCIIRDCLIKRRADIPPVDKQQGDVAIKIPTSRSKDPQVYNHMSKHGKECVCEGVEDLFKINMWTELSQRFIQRQVKQMTVVRAWCEEHGIDIDYADTIRQRYYRMQRQYENKGVKVEKNKRNHSDYLG